MELKRAIHADTLTAIAGQFHPVSAIDLEWPGGNIRVHSGVGNLAWDSRTFLGVGHYGDLSMPSEEGGIVPPEAAISILGTAEDLFADAADAERNAMAQIYFGLVTEPAGNTLIGDLIDIYTGHLDAAVVPIAEENEFGLTHRLQLSFKSGPGARSRADFVHSFEDQARAFPGDTAGRHVIGAWQQALVTKWPEN